MKFVWSREKIAAAILLVILYAILGIIIAFQPGSPRVTASEAVLSEFGSSDYPCSHKVSRSEQIDLGKLPHANPAVTEAWCIQVEHKCMFGPSMTPSFTQGWGVFDAQKVRGGWQVTFTARDLTSCLTPTTDEQ